jgi:hypothetical protein
MSTNRPPSHAGLFGWSNTGSVSRSNTDNASLNQQLTSAIAPCFAPASRGIPSPQRRSDGDSSGREHDPKPRPHAPNAPEGPKRSSPRQLDTSANSCAEPKSVITLEAFPVQWVTAGWGLPSTAIRYPFWGGCPRSARYCALLLAGHVRTLGGEDGRGTTAARPIADNYLVGQ